MKKSQFNLLRLASKFQAKYGQSQTLQQIIENAAGYGEKSANGIMDFLSKLKQDQADLALTITVDTGMMGSFKVEVSEPSVNPAQYATHYAGLAKQIKNYLDRHISNFPQIPLGTVTLRWSGRDESGIAAK